MSQLSPSTPPPPTPPLPTTAAFREAVRAAKAKVREAKVAEIQYLKAISQAVRGFKTSEMVQAVKAAKQEAINTLRQSESFAKFKKTVTDANLARGRLAKKYDLTPTQLGQIFRFRRRRRRAAYKFNLGWRFRIWF